LKNFEFENKRINSFFKKYNPIINYYKNSLGIPVFGVQYGDYCGYGAHLNGSIALTRAFLELIIGLDLNKINEIKDIHKKNLSSLVEKEIPIEKYVKNYSTGDDKKDLKILEYLLNKNNIPPIYINLTHKNSNVFVYKTLVPELFIEEKRL
jgi:ribosomal protein S12 methylthiotransferase accessory factor YcaO